MSSGFRQEMPPKEGFGPIHWQRIPLKKPWSGLKLFSAYIAFSGACQIVYMYGIKNRRRNKRANDDVTVALEPLLVAERDRMYLTQLYKNRKEEAELMKNVPGWKVGTWMGEPIYHTVGDTLIEPYHGEYYAHCNPKDKEAAFYFDFLL